MSTEQGTRSDRIDERQMRFQALLTAHRGIVLKVAYTYCRREADRDDLVQEICTELWRSFGRYDASRPFSTWMYRVALNVAISQVRRAASRRLPLASLDGEEATRVPAPSALEPDERLADLDRVIARLDPLDRALALLYLEERSYREIADILGVTQTNVATKISRLKQRIRNDLAAPRPPEGDDPWSSTTSRPPGNRWTDASRIKTR